MMSALNNQNGRKDTRPSKGPKSVSGKARASLNALRHGLAIPISSDPKLCVEAEALALRISKESSPHLLARAWPVAEAQVALVRVRLARCGLEAQLLSKLDATLPTSASILSASESPSGSILRASTETNDVGPTIDELLRKIEKIDRYEGRSRSRRNRAMEIFDAVRVVEAGGAESAEAIT